MVHRSCIPDPPSGKRCFNIVKYNGDQRIVVQRCVKRPSYRCISYSNGKTIKQVKNGCPDGNCH